jgi:flagellar motor switch protein FliM
VSSETLSQSEIDLLLGAKERRAEPVERRYDQDVQIYDFRRPHRVSKERLRTLEAMYGRLAKSLEGWLMGRVRGQVELTLQSVEQFSFGEFTLSLSTPCCSYIFDVRDSGGQRGVIDFGKEFAFFLVDSLFGGAGGQVMPDRMLTPIERMAVRVVAERVSTLVCEIWEDHTEMELLLSGWESIPEILQAANRDDPVLVANIEVAAAGLRSLLMICLPFSVLEKFFVSSGGRRVSSVVGSEREREANREMTETSLRATNVDIAARLPEFRVKMGDLARMKVGSVLSTGIPCSAEIEVLVSGQRRFRELPGRVGRALAVRVVAPLESMPGSAPPPPPNPSTSSQT